MSEADLYELDGVYSERKSLLYFLAFIMQIKRRIESHIGGKIYKLSAGKEVTMPTFRSSWSAECPAPTPSAPSCSDSPRRSGRMMRSFAS